MTVNLTRIYTQARRRRRDAPRRYEPGVEAASPRRGLRDRRRAQRHDRRGPARARAARPLRRVAAARPERPARRRRRPVGARTRSRGGGRGGHARAAARRPRLHELARAGVRRGQRDARAAALVRDPRRHPGGGAAARVPDRLPPRRATRDRRRRGGQPRGGALPEPPLGPAVHPQPRRQPRAAAGSEGAEPLWEPGAPRRRAGHRAS